MTIGEVLGSTNPIKQQMHYSDVSEQPKTSVANTINVASNLFHLPPGSTHIPTYKDNVKQLDPDLYMKLYANCLPLGIFKYANGDVYEGEWKDCKRHGKGKYTTQAGDVYEGDWKEDQADGFGKCIYARGDTYFGPYKNGMRKGWGEYTFPDGAHYRGNWVNNRMEGDGSFFYPSGEICNGKFVDQMVKKAIVTTCGSDCYCGEWGIEERRHGEGYYKSTNGEQYQGKWKNDKKDGYGKCSRPNGYYYEGFWKDDKPHGEGTLVLGEGTLTSPADKFVGTFEKGQKHGEGTYWNIWGRQSKQEWIHGQQQRHF